MSERDWSEYDGFPSDKTIPLSERVADTYDWLGIVGANWNPAEVAKLEERIAELSAENEKLQDAIYHSGYDWDDCIDCGGPPHNEYCRFWKLRHLFPLWFERQGEDSPKEPVLQDTPCSP